MADPTDYPEDGRPVVEEDVDPEAPADAPPSELAPDAERPGDVIDELAEENAATSLDQPSDSVE